MPDYSLILGGLASDDSRHVEHNLLASKVPQTGHRLVVFGRLLLLAVGKKPMKSNSLLEVQDRGDMGKKTQAAKAQAAMDSGQTR